MSKSIIQDPKSNIQNTLGEGFELSGVGLHSGVMTKVRVLPAGLGEGRYFVRVDLPGSPVIPAQVSAVVSTTLSTELGNGAAKVRTVEHLLASLAAMGVDNARIEIDGAEVPLLDGSGLPWVEAIAQVGVIGTGDWLRQKQESDFSIFHFSFFLDQPIWIYDGDAFVAALPAPATRFTYGIDFDLPAIGNQWHSWSPDTASFAAEVAPARTDFPHHGNTPF